MPLARKRYDPKVKGALDRTAITMGLVHGFEVELSAFFDPRGPTIGDRFCACVEFERIWTVLVQMKAVS